MTVIRALGPVRKDPPSLRPQPARNGPDFWSTPESLIAALVNHVLPALANAVAFWEPASGDGRLITAIQRATGKLVYESDLYPLGSGEPIDYLDCTPPPLPAFVVTNGPFNKVDGFINRSLDLMDAGKISGACLLLRHDHLMAKNRCAAMNRATWEIHCNWRPYWITGSNGQPRWAFAWVVWVPRAPRRAPLYLAERGDMP